MRSLLVFVFCLAMAFDAVCAQTALPPADSSVIGIWKGRSICQIKSCPCHDEVVIYHISKGKEQDQFSIRANKLVQGREEDMGVIVCTWNRNNNQLISADQKTVWTFILKGRSMDGTLMVSGALYRMIKLSKQW